MLATEAQLSAMGGDDLGDDLARSESLREKARGLASLLAERKRGIERDRSALVDRAVISTLEAEAARLENPERIEKLAVEYLAMAPSKAEHEAAPDELAAVAAGHPIGVVAAQKAANAAAAAAAAAATKSAQAVTAAPQ